LSQEECDEEDIMIPLSTPLLGPPTPPQSVELVPFTLGIGFLFFSGVCQPINYFLLQNLLA